MKQVPFNRAFSTGKEASVLQEAMQGSIAGDGQFTRRCHDLLQRELKAPKALLTTSCTDALEMTALLLSFEPGDEVIVPSFTFVSTAVAYLLHGAKPIFADIDPDTLNIDPADVERKISPRTRAIVAVHYGGLSCDMPALRELADRAGAALIEDAAHSLFAKVGEQYLGTIGDFGTFSFHETKNFTCGEGGALLVNNDEFAERADIIWEKGTDRRQFKQGIVDKYTWRDLGASYLPSDLLAALLYDQLEHRDQIFAERRRVWNSFETELGDWIDRHGVKTPQFPAGHTNPYHLFYFIMPTAADRDRFITESNAAGVKSVFHYLPLHCSPMGEAQGGKRGDCPITEDLSARLVRLPLFAGMQDDELERILNFVRQFRLA